VEIGFFFPKDYLIPEYFFMTNPMVIFIFYFGDILSKFSFCLNSILKDTEISKKEQFYLNHIQPVLKIEFYDDFEHKESKNQNIVPTVFRDIRIFVIISITSRFCFL
jgi:hypothetical protein